MPRIGFSTGALALGDFQRALTMLAQKSVDAIELSALRVGELPALAEAMKVVDLTPYRYVSFHAPTDADDENALICELEKIAERGINIVVHPDTIKNAESWQCLHSRLCIENMDSRKSTGRTADELSVFFTALPEARLCFDVAHARQVDPTMTEAAKILHAFGDRLAQVHLSEVDGRGRHFALTFTSKAAYKPFASELSKTPVILESPVSESEIEDELKEAREVLKGNEPTGGRTDPGAWGSTVKPALGLGRGLGE